MYLYINFIYNQINRKKTIISYYLLKIKQILFKSKNEITNLNYEFKLHN